jgi:hypothetical protein
MFFLLNTKIPAISTEQALQMSGVGAAATAAQ